MKIIKYEEFKKQGEALFGPDPREWLFECPSCKTAQTFHDFAKLGITAENVPYLLGHECIGRYDKSKGCLWVVGDVFVLHKIEIDRGREKHEPHFKLVGT